jgi:hypothetical protein
MKFMFIFLFGRRMRTEKGSTAREMSDERREEANPLKARIDE